MKKEPAALDAEPTMYETSIDLPKAGRVELNQILNQRLADAVDLQSQVKQAHWNVKDAFPRPARLMNLRTLGSMSILPSAQ